MFSAVGRGGRGVEEGLRGEALAGVGVVDGDRLVGLVGGVGVEDAGADGGGGFEAVAGGVVGEVEGLEVGGVVEVLGLAVVVGGGPLGLGVGVLGVAAAGEFGCSCRRVGDGFAGEAAGEAEGFFWGAEADEDVAAGGGGGHEEAGALGFEDVVDGVD